MPKTQLTSHKCSTNQSQLLTHFGLSDRTKIAQMCETLRVLRSVVEDTARELGMAEDDLLAVAAGTFRKGAIIEKDQLKSLEEYESLSGVSIGDSVREALEDFIECSIPPRLEALAERSAQS